MKLNLRGISKNKLLKMKKKSHDNDIRKKKQTKAQKKSKIKLSNYEKAVQKFRQNHQLCSQSKIVNKRITTGSLKIKPSQDGLFLKGRRASFMRRNPLNKANQARKNEDINKIIDIGKEFSRKRAAKRQKREELDILKRLGFCETASDEDKNSVKEKTLSRSDSEDEISCSIKHDKRKNQKLFFRNQTNDITSKKGLKNCFRFTEDSSSSDSSLISKIKNCLHKKRRKIGGNHKINELKHGTSTSDDSLTIEKFNELLLKGFKSSSSSPDTRQRTDKIHRGECGRLFDVCSASSIGSTSSSASRRKNGSKKPEDARKINLNEFNEFVARYENAVPRVTCDASSIPDVMESAIHSLKDLYCRRREKKNCWEEFLLHKGFTPQRVHDPVLSWVMNASPELGKNAHFIENRESWLEKSEPKAHIFDVPETNFNEVLNYNESRIHLLQEYDGRRNPDDPNKTYKDIVTPSPQYYRRNMF